MNILVPDTSACGCCEGISIHTPRVIDNRPSLPEITYRIGTHWRFKQSMLARLSTNKYPALSMLRTRQDDDFSIALMDAWAMVADVLTFYQERIANESYLRTAVERLSLLNMARLIGYQLGPGVAASAYLAFELETAKGSPSSTSIGKGVMINSTPGPDEKPQTFETVEAITARPQWNEIQPRLGNLLTLSTDLTTFYLEGQQADVKKGDTVLIAAGSSAGERAVKRVAAISVDKDYDVTRVDLESIPASVAESGLIPIVVVTPVVVIAGASFVETSASPSESPLYQAKTQLNDQTVQEKILGASWQANDLLALVETQGWVVEELSASIIAGQPQLSTTSQTGIFVFRQRGHLFGYTAPKKVTYQINGQPDDPANWTEWALSDAKTSEVDDQMFLDTTYEKVVSDGYVAVQTPGSTPQAFPIEDVVVQPRTDYGISGKSTMIKLAGGETWWDTSSDSFSVIRGSSVYLESEKLELAQVPDKLNISGQTIVLDSFYAYLKAEQNITIQGTPIDQTDVTRSELATISKVELTADGFTRLTLSKALSNTYKRTSVKINSNVALSTHGVTVSEVLGSGDATKTNQKFKLKQPPVTYTSASTPSGRQSTLEVRVNDVLWKEVSTLYGSSSNDAVYITRLDDDGDTTVIFGDGNNGRLLPSGSNNVRATYRKGIGLNGLVKARQLDQLLTRPLGVKAVVNPLESSGADDPESLSEARVNAPLTVLTLDRIVSLKDFEDFACAFAGVAKASAVWVWDGKYQSVFITVAGPKGKGIPTDSSVYKNLLEAIRKVADPTARFQIETYRKALFRIHGSVKVDPTYLIQKVLQEVKDALRAAFSFEKRDFGQDVVLSEVIAIMQGVEGVISVDVDKLFRSDKPQAWNNKLKAASPKMGAEENVRAAELLTLDPAPLDSLEAVE